MRQLASQGQFGGIGVGFGGPVDVQTGRICCSHQVPGWSEFPLREWLHSVYPIPVFVDNDANVGALGEATYGAGQGMDPVFYSTLGSGVGGGCVAQGKIYHGCIPGEVEFGHLRLDRTGITVESQCSGWAVDAKIRKSNQSHPQGVLAQLCEGSKGGEARHLTEAIRRGDLEAKRILTDTAEDLAFALSHVTHLLHPQVLVLGGGLGLMGEPLREAVVTAIGKYIMHAFQPGPVVKVAALGEDAIPMGALTLAR